MSAGSVLEDSVIYVGTSMANTSLNDSVVYVATFKEEKKDDSVAILNAVFPKKEEHDDSVSSASYSADDSSSDSSLPDFTLQLIELYKRRNTLLAQNGEGANQHAVSIGK